ncbi:matrixin family metalloprotease [Streptococcus dentapri]|uniref:Matrixin family metalloprotease n=1 Tax=Streptococcus dentapri TaxID=573564 RepID=A0ABV8D396_9STRE
MKKIFKFLLYIPGEILGFLWRFFWSLLKTALIIALVVLCLVWYSSNSNSQFAQSFKGAFSNISSHLSSDKDLGKDIERLATDAGSHTEGARWSNNSATVYIASSNSTLASAYQEALLAWNNTGAFTFNLINDKDAADIILDDRSDSSSQAAGEAQSTTDALSNRINHVDVYLNSYYLLDDAYGYTYERIVNTAEHELGHAIGLEHNDSETSVMQSAGSYYAIQQTDIVAVQKLYAN